MFMESKPTSGGGGGGGVVRREGTVSRYDPYAAVVTGNKVVDQMKEGVVQLGVEFSLCVAESMFLLCDDRKIMLFFCYMICKTGSPDDPVSGRLLRVMHHVYTNEIVSKNRLHDHADKISPSSVHCGLIGNAWKDFDYVNLFLRRLATFLIRKRYPFQHGLSTMDTSDIKRQLIKKLDDKLRYAKDASEANGFERERLESTISGTWKSLFNVEEDAGEAKAIKIRLLRDLFHPLFGGSWQPEWVRPSQSTRPQPLHIIGKVFAEHEELREEAVRLGVELSLYAAEAMFLLCDDIRSVLLFCRRLWVAVENDLKQPNDSPVIERLLRVLHYVYLKHIKPKNGAVFREGGRSLQWRLAMACFEDFHVGIRDLDGFVREGRQEFTPSGIEKALKNIEEKLRCAKAVSEANGFARNAMESDVLIMWKSLFDKPTDDLWTVNMKKLGILNDMFQPLHKEIAKGIAEGNSFVRSISCLNICD